VNGNDHSDERLTQGRRILRVFADRSRTRSLALVAAIVFAGCSRPPAVEFDNLKYIQFLRTAVSSRNLEMLEKVESAIERRHEDEQMSDAELEHFQTIIAVARDGKWADADKQAFAFEEGQLSRSRSRPASAGHEHEHEHEH